MNRRETPEVAEAVQRLIRAVGRRIAVDGNPEWLDELRQLDTALAEAYVTAIAGLRGLGFSDAEIARPLGVTRQNVRQRWPHDSAPPAASPIPPAPERSTHDVH